MKTYFIKFYTNDGSVGMTINAYNMAKCISRLEELEFDFENIHSIVCDSDTSLFNQPKEVDSEELEDGFDKKYALTEKFVADFKKRLNGRINSCFIKEVRTNGPEELYIKLYKEVKKAVLNEFKSTFQ